jgi:hypothetical protein
MIQFYVDFKIQSPNVNEHWSKAHRRNKNNYLRLISIWRKEKIGTHVKAPCTVKITRIYNPSKWERIFDSDNFIAACKGIRDELSNLILPGLAAGQADNEDRGITFEYYQKKGDGTSFKIEIEVK